jgi:outer membrane lipoprotein-sorting protein
VNALLLVGVLATVPNVDELVKRLEASSRDITTLAGDFTQVSRVKLFKKELRSRGRLRFRRPRQIRWEYVDPDPSTLILDGNRAILKMPDAPPQIFDLERDATMRAVFDQLLLWLSPGSLDGARADYSMTAGGSAEAPTLTLVPKAGSPLERAFRRVELRFDGRTGLLRGLLLVEKNGDEKEIAFTRLERNVAIPDAEFR